MALAYVVVTCVVLTLATVYSMGLIFVSPVMTVLHAGQKILTLVALELLGQVHILMEYFEMGVIYGAWIYGVHM